CGITVNGTIWGDGNLGALASLVTLNAAGAIDEPLATAMIGAGTLTGLSGWHANLGEVGAVGTTYNKALSAANNRIVTLGSFQSNVFADDPLGLLLRDGRALNVAGPVTDSGAAASQGISIAVAPGTGTTYTAADLTLQNTISAATTVRLQATGNVVEQAGGV